MSCIFLRKILKSLCPLCLVLFVVAGCGPAISTLQRYSKEQDLIEREVERAKKKFDLLVEDIKQERLKEGRSKRKFIRIYGKPVITNAIDSNEAVLELLYRDPLKFFDTPKVYVYFNKEEKLIRWVYEEPEQK